MMSWFGDAMGRIKYADARATDVAIKASRGTGFYPRDLMMAAYSGTIIGPIDVPDGQITVKKRGIFEVSFQGARFEATANKAMGNGSFTPPDYADPVIDTAGMIDPAQPTGLVVPTHVEIINVTGGFLSSGSTGSRCRGQIIKNGTDLLCWWDGSSSGTRGMVLSTGPIPVVPDDFLEVQWYSNSNWTVLGAPQTFIAAEILAASFQPGT